MKRVLTLFTFFLFFLHFTPVRIALAAMSSTNYRIPSEVIGNGGGRGTSNSYILFDSLGEVGPQPDAAGSTGSTSTSFRLSSGFETQAPEPTFVFTISGTSVNLSPEPSLTETSTGTTTLSTTTNAPFGYTTTIYEDTNLKEAGNHDINDVLDGAVGPPGTEEYGIALSGSDRAFSDERAIISTPSIVASSSVSGTNRAVIVTYKMTMTGGTLNGTYSHTVTYVSTPNY